MCPVVIAQSRASAFSIDPLLQVYYGALRQVQKRSRLRTSRGGRETDFPQDANPEPIVWEPCFGLDPAFELDLGEVSIGERSECSGDIEVTIPELYLGGFDFSVTTESPSTSRPSARHR